MGCDLCKRYEETYEVLRRRSHYVGRSAYCIASDDRSSVSGIFSRLTSLPAIESSTRDDRNENHIPSCRDLGLPHVLVLLNGLVEVGPGDLEA